jgi:outer membrane protein OmpA-like peptidoglycan-associated protein
MKMFLFCVIVFPFYSSFGQDNPAAKQEATAIDIKGSMDSLGKIALYGIFFDAGKSNIKPESAKELKAIANYLEGNPTITIYLVSHTDNVGAVNANLALSKKRGEAVKQYLVEKLMIDPNRLTGGGVGQLCPITSNDTEAGRKLNRRLEIVKK